MICLKKLSRPGFSACFDIGKRSSSWRGEMNIERVRRIGISGAGKAGV
jgi:hypothetical protein